MTNMQRKAAIAAYKERKSQAGIYAIRCQTSGQCWVGRSLDLDKIENRLWFTLRQGGNPHRNLQQAWQQHGAESFTLQRMEILDEEELDYIRDAKLKDRLTHWCKKLKAEAI
ncbi:GIY-YIG nuclease family protein [Ferrovibrio sp.]|uniref:GIY-YIG nuclease family protein n=1 Tax=Ferrovibrio sp. TaxID=1917215 RepID=UPI0025C00876|nr:GIY-YIG nuclease family protein [Ferrovibrio sp.]MBX3454412.1 GIY-YIG nuclease family protein [Ferrovibrio sp.]